MMKYYKLVFFTLFAFILSVSALGYAIRSQAVQNGPVAETAQAADQVEEEVLDQEAMKVTAIPVSSNTAAYITLLGTVKSENLVKVFPASSGQITAVYAKEGAYVNQGDTLFAIGGVNGNQHVSQYQLEIAQTNYESAQRAYDLTQQGNDVSYKTAWLQLENAKHQLQGTQTDLEVLNRNVNAARNGLTILNDSLQATRYKNTQDKNKTEAAINSLILAINDLSAKRAHVTDPAALAEIDKAIKDLNTQLSNAQFGYETLKAGIELSENAILAQIQTASTQIEVLDLNKQSAQQKLGLNYDSSDPLKLAEEGVEGILVKNEASLLQSESQLELARKNYEMAQMQQDTLTVKAPSSGLLAEVTASTGDMVSPQLMLTQIVNSNNFELRVSVDADTANKIKVGSAAEVQINGAFVKTHVKSVSPIADAVSKLVSVSINLPNTFFRANQTLDARIAVAAGNGSGAYFIPLDAVIIGTEEKYVFVYDNGKAKRVVVKIGSIANDQVEITEGLNAADQVIVEGAKSLLEGQAVTLE